MISVVYPYVFGADMFEELRYSLRSLEQHFKEEFEVVIVGYIPDWIKNVRTIPVKRQVGMKENVTYDAIWKMMQIVNSPLVSEYFIRMYDDIYFLQSTTIDDISVIRANEDMNKLDFNQAGGTGSNTWKKQLWDTYHTIKRQGWYGWNTETHLPERFDKMILRWIIEKFNCLDLRLLTSSLYFNHKLHWNRKPPKIVNKLSGDKAGFYGNFNKNWFKSSTEKEVLDAIEGKRWLNHDDVGCTEPLRNVIRDLFPYKSRFEK